MESRQLALEFPLGGRDALVLSTQLVELLVGVAELLFGLATAAVGLLEQSARLFELVLQGVGATLGNAVLLASLVAGALFLFEGLLHLLELLLVTLDVLLALGVGLVGVVKSDLELVDVGLELLLHAQGLSLALSFSLQRGLHGVQGALVVLAGVLEFLFLLLDATVNLLADLAELQLGAQDLVLLLFEGGLSLLESGLELVLFDFQTLARLLDLVDVAATFADLVEQVLDLISQVLVLTADSLKLLLALIVGALKTEQLGGVVAALLLGGVELGGQIVDLELPFADDLVEVLLLLLGGVGDQVSAIDLEGQVLDFGGQTLAGLLQGDNLLVEGLDGLLSLGEAGLQLALGLLEFLRAGDALGLVLGTPQLGIGVGLAELALDVNLAFGFFLHLLADVVQVVLQVAELAEKSGAFL